MLKRPNPSPVVENYEASKWVQRAETLDSDEDAIANSDRDARVKILSVLSRVSRHKRINHPDGPNSPHGESESPPMIRGL